MRARTTFVRSLGWERDRLRSPIGLATEGGRAPGEKLTTAFWLVHDGFSGKLPRMPYLRLVSLAVLALSTGFAAADRNWSHYLGDAGATHYSTLTQIDPKNVMKLERAWEYRTGDAAANNR